MRRLSTAAGLSTVFFAALLAAAGGCSSTPAASTAPASTVINLGLPTSVTSFANADVAVAQAEGYFRAEHLTVNVKNLASGVPVVQGVVGGSLDIGATSFEPVANAVNLAYLLMAFLGVLRWPRMAGAMVALIALRSLLLATVEAPEARYTLECFPLLFILAACYLTTRVVPGGNLGWKTAPAIGEL